MITARFSKTILIGFVMLGALSCVVYWSCTTASGNQSIARKQPESHQKMLDILAETRRKMYNPSNGFSAEAKLIQCDSVIATLTDPLQLNTYKFIRANILLEYGDEPQAVATYESLLPGVAQMSPAGRQQFLVALGTAYMRLAERNNCVAGHTSDACIMPIQGSGIHRDKSAAQKAIATFEAVLKEDPKNLDAIWLLNIAHMVLGQYPQQVPPQWLVPGLDVEEYKVQPFLDMASDLKIAVNNRAGGSIVEDFDNDGFLDIIISAWGMDDPMHFFRNNGDGSFSDVSQKSGLDAITGGLNMTSTDYNNDGFVDIFVLRGAWQGQVGFGNQPNSLLKNNGDGTFTDVTLEAGLLSYHPTQTATWNDFNNDGWLDLFIGNETSSAKDVHPCELYLNNKNGTFTNATNQTRMGIRAFIKGVTSGDIDNDGWPDVFISTLNGVRLLLHNTGTAGFLPVFEDVSEKSGFPRDKAGAMTFPTFFFDYDNDGWLDLFFCNYDFDRPLSYYSAKEALNPSKDMAGKPYIYRNNRNGTFSDVTPQMGINKTTFAMGANFGDIDNDGWLDMYLGTGNPSYMSLVPNKLYKNLGGKRFADATVSSRLGNLQKGHGVSFADIDNDGDQDIHIDMGGALRGDGFPNAMYMNPGQSTNNWICLKLEGTQSNRAAIGAKVTVKFRENGQHRIAYREVNSGGSFGCSPFRREIGIGQATVIDEITIQWPASKITQTIKNVQPNQYLKIREGKEGFETASRQKLIFKKADGTIPMCAPTK